jgi:putative DNA primase/helicase
MSAKTIESDAVRNAARGAWLSVLDSLAPELERAIDKPGKRHIGCPVHGGNDGFRLFRDADISGGGICNSCGAKPDGFSLLMWLRGWSFPEALSSVANELGISTDSNHKKPVVNRKPVAFDRSKSSVEDKRLKVILRTVWQESKPISHPDAEPVRLYLQSRGLDSFIPDWPSIRFHPNMQYRNEDGKLIGHFPAMLALVENGNEAITIHRTFLTEDGRKASVESPKKMMPVPSNKLVVGSAIRLGNPGRVLGVTEGIETALAVFEATGMVTWSLISATMMSLFLIPSGVEKLIIWSDLDRSFAGSFAAQKLAERAKSQGIEAIIREPKGPLPADVKSVDWLDVLNQHGPNAFALRSCS